MGSFIHQSEKQAAAAGRSGKAKKQTGVTTMQAKLIQLQKTIGNQAVLQLGRDKKGTGGKKSGGEAPKDNTARLIEILLVLIAIDEAYGNMQDRVTGGLLSSKDSVTGMGKHNPKRRGQGISKKQAVDDLLAALAFLGLDLASHEQAKQELDKLNKKKDEDDDKGGGFGGGGGKSALAY